MGRAGRTVAACGAVAELRKSAAKVDRVVACHRVALKSVDRTFSQSRLPDLRILHRLFAKVPANRCPPPRSRTQSTLCLIHVTLQSWRPLAFDDLLVQLAGFEFAVQLVQQLGPLE